MDSAAAIHASQMSQSLKDIAEKVRVGTATAADVNAALITHAEKQVLLDVLGPNETQAGVVGSSADLPLKALVLVALGNLALALTGAAGVGAVGTVVYTV